MHDESAQTTWLERLRAGDEAALGPLFQHYRPRLRRMVKMRMDPRVAGRVDPSDVLQEAYLDAERRVARYLEKPAVSCFVWLRGITCDRLLKTHRRHLETAQRTALRELQLPEASSVLLAATLSPATSPSRAAARDEIRRRVEQAILGLDAKDREVVLLRHFEELSNAQVAEVLGLTESGASMRHGRALFHLKEILKQLLPSSDRLE